MDTKEENARHRDGAGCPPGTDRPVPARGRWLRPLAGGTGLLMAWMVAGPVLGATLTPPPGPHKARGHARRLSDVETRRIIGARAVSERLLGAESEDRLVSAASGSGDAWEGSVDGTNTSNGNKLSKLPLTGWKVRGGRLAVSLSLFHNSQGTPNSELAPKWSHSYEIFLVADSSGNMGVRWGDGKSYTFIKNIDGSYTAPAGIHETLTVSGTGAAAVYTLTQKDQTVYTFTFVGDASTGQGGWYCTSIKDRNNNAITIAYNAANGFVTSVTDPTGRVLTLAYTNGKITGITDPLGRQWTLSYDATSGDMTGVSFPAVTTPSGTTTYGVVYGYNASHAITSCTDMRGKTWTKGYNADGSLAWEKDPLQSQTSYGYHSSYTTITDANNYVTRHNYSGGKLATVVHQSNSPESYGYDEANNKSSVTDKRGKVWAYTYDGRGNQLTATNPLQQTTTATYNTKNDPLTVTTPLGRVTSYGYDAAGNLTSITDPLTHQRSFTVNGQGQVTAETNALGKQTTFVYNTNGDRTNATDPLFHTSSTAFDALGRVTSSTDATSRATTIDYDALGRVASVTMPGGRTNTFTYSGGSDLKASVTDPLSKTTTLAYDDAGRLVSKKDPLNHLVRYFYDAAGRLTELIDAKVHSTWYARTPRGELSRVTYHDGTSTEYASYLPTGEVRTRTNARNGQYVTTTYGHDDAGRLTGMSYSDGTTASVSFGYDADGRRTAMADGTGTSTFAWDDAGRLTGRTTPQGSVTFAYDAANRQTARTLAGSGLSTFGYDDAGRMTSATNPGAGGTGGTTLTTAYTHDAAGRVLTVTGANGDVQTNAYSPATGELASLTHRTAAGATISSHTYTYRADGRKTAETTADGATVSYGYDVAGQLTAETKTGSGGAPLYSLAYTYDPAGNRLTRSLNGGAAEVYDYDAANKLLSAGTKTYTYDGSGNTKSVYDSASGITTVLTWDAEDRLLAVSNNATGAGAVSSTYSYNGLGQRVTKSGTGGTASYVRANDAIDAPVLSDGAAAYARDAGGNLLSENRAGTSRFYKSDGLGTTRALTDASGTTTDTLSTDAFGNAVAATGSTPSPFGFVAQAGYQQDRDTGLMLLGYRYYDPSTGRFLSRDPIRDGDNWYTYCANDPANAVDPDGQKLIGIGLSALAALGVAGVADVQIYLDTADWHVGIGADLGAGVGGLGAGAGLVVSADRNGQLVTGTSTDYFVTGFAGVGPGISAGATWPYQKGPTQANLTPSGGAGFGPTIGGGVLYGVQGGFKIDVTEAIINAFDKIRELF